MRLDKPWTSIGQNSTRSRSRGDPERLLTSACRSSAERSGRGVHSRQHQGGCCAHYRSGRDPSAREPFRALSLRDLYGVRLVALFLDAIFLNVRPKGPKEGVLCAWGFTRGGRAGPRRGLPGDARVARGLALPRSRPDRPRARGADARRRRRRPRADQGRRAVLASLGSPALLRSPRAQPDRQAARARARAGAPRLLAGARPSHRTSATQHSGSRPSSPSSSGPATRRPPGAWPTTSTRSSSTCATRCDTASAGARPTCSSARSARSSEGPR